jgi:hypothetical protein
MPELPKRKKPDDNPNKHSSLSEEEAFLEKAMEKAYKNSDTSPKHSQTSFFLPIPRKSAL